MSMLPRWFWKVMLVLWVISLVLLMFNFTSDSLVKTACMTVIFAFGIYFAIKMLKNKAPKK